LCLILGDPLDCPACGKHEKKEALSIFRELWSEGNPSLRRMYSSWEELERHIELKSAVSDGRKKQKGQPCPYCGAVQEVSKPLNGVFPYRNCEVCNKPFYINNDLSLRKLTQEEKAEIPGAWIQVVEDLAKKKVAVVFRLE
jgi:hypothetical protein